MSHNSRRLWGGLAAASVFLMAACVEPEVAETGENTGDGRVEMGSFEVVVVLDEEDILLEEEGDLVFHSDSGDCWYQPPQIPQKDLSGIRINARPVVAGLDWLQKHQSPEGYWDADRFMEQDDHKDKAMSDGPGNLLNDVGLTGLAILAMQGNGSTLAIGPHKKNLSAALSWLRDNQNDRGLFGEEAGNATLYNHGIATLALSEASYLTNNAPVFRKPLQKAVDLILKARNPYGAWRYSLSPNGDNDTSITGWMVSALTSAKDNGAPIDSDVFAGAEVWFDSMLDKKTGRVGYAWGNGGSGPGAHPMRNPAMREAFPAERSEALTAVTLLARMYMTNQEEIKSWKDHSDYDLMKKQIALIAAKPPVWNEEDGSIDLYYWYFATLAMVQWGGPEYDAWLKAVSKALIPNQRLENENDNFYGSWDPVGPWGKEGGRVYSTALCTMIMEVYYRDAIVRGLRGPGVR